MTNPYYIPQKPRQSAKVSQQFNDMNQMEKTPKPEFNWGALATGAAGVIGNYSSMANQGFNFDDVASSQQDPSMAPTYTAGNLSSQVSQANPQGASGGEILSGVAQGAASGSAFGPIGTAVGGAIGALGSVIGGGVRKRRQKRERRRAQQTLSKAQSQYNQQDLTFRAQQNSMEDAQDLVNPQARMYNLYRSQNQ